MINKQTQYSVDKVSQNKLHELQRYLLHITGLNARVAFASATLRLECVLCNMLSPPPLPCNVHAMATHTHRTATFVWHVTKSKCDNEVRAFKRMLFHFNYVCKE